MDKILANYTKSELEQLAVEMGHPKFRGAQLYEWIIKSADWSEMSNMPQPFVAKLKENGYIAQCVKIMQRLVSEKDGTKKYIFELYDGNIIEGVLMKYKYGNTICVSTQVGCRMNCGFCASGLCGLVRNLEAGEILGQVLSVNKDNIGADKVRAITNIVLMGSGEPLDNYSNVTKFLTLVSSEEGLNISRRNLSLSTCGLCDKIYSLADDGFSPTLTISLHAPNDTLRREIMPVANKFAISDIMKAVKYYFDVTGRRIIFEYSMIKDFNDSVECARELAGVLRGIPCHVNVINLNFVKEKNLHGSTKDKINAFLDTLESHNISCTLRRTMGGDIEGACGQLRQSYLDKKDNE